MATESRFLDPSLWNARLFSSGWRDAATHADVTEPATGRVASRVGVASPADISQAAALATGSQADWHAMNFDVKAAILRRAATLLDTNSDEVADWISRETGSTTPKAQFEIGSTIRCFHEAASMPSQPHGLVLPSNGRLSLARRVPLGVIGVITPFNFPLYLSARAVAPALALGNAVVLKPDLRTPVAGGFILARLFEEAGLPTGLLHVLPGGAAAGEALCMDPNVAMIQFTGSTATGRRIGALAGAQLKKMSLELGGKNSLIVLDDADLELAASNAAFGAYLHQGQICMASGRILVQKSIIGEFSASVAAKARALSVGDPADHTHHLGPLISDAQRDRAHEIVHDSVRQGARLLEGGNYKDRFYRPTVLAGVRPGMRAYDEEFFAPVLSLIEFDTDEEAVVLANDTDYGLAAAVISRSVERALNIGNRLKVGLLHINDQTVNEDGVNPFGGRGKSGNGTNIGGPANWEEFTQWQWVTLKDKPTRYPF